MHNTLARLIRWLIGPATLSDDRMDGITLAIQEEGVRLTCPLGHVCPCVPGSISVAHCRAAVLLQLGVEP